MKLHQVLKKQRFTRKLVFAIATLVFVGAAAYTAQNIYTADTYAASPESCFAFLSGTITAYYTNENNDPNNPACPTDVSIPSTISGTPVTAIGDYALSGMQLTSLAIPSGVTSIGNSAFSTNPLTSVVIPESVTSIGQGAFTSNRLTSVTIPSNLTSIEDGVFSYNQLASVTIPANVTTIGQGAFAMNKLTSVSIPNGVTSIGQNAFKSNELTSVTIPAGVTTIELGAFSNNKLASVTIPGGVTTIEFEAFSSNNLTSVTLPESVMYIDGYAFADNQLPSVTIPNGVTYIGDFAFKNNKLTAVTIPSGLTGIDRGVFSGNLLSSVTIPQSVTYIDRAAFAINKLTDVIIPNNVTSISPTAFFGQNPWGGVIDNSSDPAHDWYSSDPIVQKTVYDNLWYVRLYTDDPANPNHLADGIANEYYWTGDITNDGDQSDSIGGHIINPASATIKYIDNSNHEIAPSNTITGHLASDGDLADYHVAAIDGIPDITDAENPTADEQAAVSAKLAQFYRVGNTVLFTAPTITGYTLSAPASPHQQTLTADNNNVLFGYTALGGQQPPVIVAPAPSQPTTPTTQPTPTATGSITPKHIAPSRLNTPQPKLEAAAAATTTPRATFDFLHETDPASQVQATPLLTNSHLAVDTTKPCSDIKSANLLASSSFSAPNKTDSVLGGVSFVVGCSVKGGNATATITLGEALPNPSAVKAYKLDASGKPVDVTSQVQLANESGRTVLRYDLRDGQQFDDDHTADGSISDPLYITTPSQTASTPEHASARQANSTPWLISGSIILVTVASTIVAAAVIRTKRRL